MLKLRSDAVHCFIASIREGDLPATKGDFDCQQ